MENRMKLYDYFRSTASYRVRISLNFKQIEWTAFEVHLINMGGEQHLPAYRAINPQGMVPSLRTDEGLLTQSMAIIEYLEEVYPDPSLLPDNAYDRALVRSVAQMIACDIHPINNLRVLQRLKKQFHADEIQVTEWYHHWLEEGFNAVEDKLSQMPRSGDVCFGDSVSLADLCLIPQVYNAHRFKFSLDDYPIISARLTESPKHTSPDLGI